MIQGTDDYCKMRVLWLTTLSSTTSHIKYDWNGWLNISHILGRRAPLAFIKLLSDDGSAWVAILCIFYLDYCPRHPYPLCLCRWKGKIKKHCQYLLHLSGLTVIVPESLVRVGSQWHPTGYSSGKTADGLVMISLGQSWSRDQTGTLCFLKGNGGSDHKGERMRWATSCIQYNHGWWWAVLGVL